MAKQTSLVEVGDSKRGIVPILGSLQAMHFHCSTQQELVRTCLSALQLLPALGMIVYRTLLQLQLARNSV